MFVRVKLCQSNRLFHDDVVLTVQVALPDSLHILSVNELVAALPDNVDRRQIHVVADPDRGNRDNVSV